MKLPVGDSSRLSLFGEKQTEPAQRKGHGGYANHVAKLSLRKSNISFDAGVSVRESRESLS